MDNQMRIEGNLKEYLGLIDGVFDMPYRFYKKVEPTEFDFSEAEVYDPMGDESIDTTYYENPVIMEFHRQEELGINSWLDNQYDSLGIRMIKAYGYNHTVREKRPSLIYKSIVNSLIDLTKTNRNSANDTTAIILSDVLRKFNIDPSYFIEEVKSYKYKSDRSSISHLNVQPKRLK